MTFGLLLKKAVSFFLMPLPFGMMLLLLGVWRLYQNRTAAARRFLLASIAWISLFSYAPFANLLLYPLEHRYKALLAVPQDAAYIYVLGYGHHTDTSLPITSQVDKEAVVRLAEGIRLYHALHGKAKLILSGYSGLYDPNTHAIMQQKLAHALGIPKKTIILVPKATDTEEEAQAAKRITEFKPVILVTSAYHMPRAVMWFEHLGLYPYLAPTYHLASLSHPHYLNVFSADALKKSTIAIHEYLGILWQKIKLLEPMALASHNTGLKSPIPK